MQTRLPKTKCVWPMKINVICTVSMCANLAYFSDTPVAGNMRVLAQVLDTDSVINIKIKHVENRIVHMHHNVLSEDVIVNVIPRSILKITCYRGDSSIGPHPSS